MTEMRQNSSTLDRFREGFRAPWEGFLFMKQNPALWRFGVAPVVVNLLITLVVLLLLIAAAIGFAVYLHPRFPDATGGLVLEVLSVVALVILVAAVSAAVWALLAGILGGHYYGKLAEEVERKLGIPPDRLREIPLRYQIVDALRDFGALAGINGLFLMMNCIPGIGSVFGAVGAFLFNCYVFGRDYFDFPMALRGIRRAEQRAFYRRRRPETLGLGAAALVFNLIPVVGAVLLTTATAGAVLLYRRLEEDATVGAA